MHPSRWVAGLWLRRTTACRSPTSSLRWALASTVVLSVTLLVVLVAREGCQCNFEHTVVWRYSSSQGAGARQDPQRELPVPATPSPLPPTPSAAIRYVPHPIGATHQARPAVTPHQRELVALAQGRRRRRSYVEAPGGPLPRILKAHPAPMNRHMGGVNQTAVAALGANSDQPIDTPVPSVDFGPRIRHFPDFPFYYLRVHGADCNASQLAPLAQPSVVMSPSFALSVNDSASSVSTSAVIDFVVTYVNPLNIPHSHLSPQRVRDWNELYWSLRSMFYHGRLCVFSGQPDRCLLGRIHLVVASRAHVPAWLSRRLVGPDANGTAPLELRFRQFLRERLNVVEHKDMFPPGTPYSEAYNSNVIELNLHRIPGLSPFYLYFNNDMFLGRELRLQDIFTPSSRNGPEQELNASSPLFCDLLPITWYEREPSVRRIYPVPNTVGRFSLAAAPPARAKRSGMSEIEQMMVLNENLLAAPPFASPFLQHRFDAGDTGRPPLLRYPHVPMLYDRRTVEWIFNNTHFSPSVSSTMARPQVRGAQDLWVPYLYSNIRRLAFYGAQSLMERLFSPVTPAAHRFSMLTDLSAIQGETLWVSRNSRRAGGMLFVTLNDDFPSHIPPNVASPSLLLFNDSDTELGGILCEPRRAEDVEARTLKGLSMYSVLRVAYRYLFRMHRMYCVWEGYWAASQTPLTGRHDFPDLPGDRHTPSPAPTFSIMDTHPKS